MTSVRQAKIIPEVAVNGTTCNECVWFQHANLSGLEGECTNKKSDHYGHKITKYHLLCSEYILKQEEMDK